jgi:FixJ family two-component response regulator
LRSATLPIVFITGHGTVKVRAAGMSAGCVTVLDKPVEETALLDAIERALALSSDPAPTRP